ncbi:MAG TPA: hypothetical protein VJ438_01510 [Candidatus Nanoarchaeia archaeon]|nr:hypothetical protein [Candidatus Nanoarchaeia archaeon]
MTKETSTSSIRINPKVWEDFKIWCIRNKVAMSEKLEEMIKEVMKKREESAYLDKDDIKVIDEHFKEIEK